MACVSQKHLSTTNTGLSPAAILTVKELGQNAMLLCNTCIDNNERDAFNRNRNKKTKKFSQSQYIQRIAEHGSKSSLNGSQKNEEAFKKFREKVDGSYANVVNSSQTNVNRPQTGRNELSKVIQKIGRKQSHSGSLRIFQRPKARISSQPMWMW